MARRRTGLALAVALALTGCARDPGGGSRNEGTASYLNPDGTLRPGAPRGAGRAGTNDAPYPGAGTPMATSGDRSISTYGASAGGSSTGYLNPDGTLRPGAPRSAGELQGDMAPYPGAGTPMAGSGGSGGQPSDVGRPGRRPRLTPGESR